MFAIAARVQRDDCALREPPFRDVGVGALEGGGEVVLAHDLVEIENRARAMAARSWHALGDASTDHVERQSAACRESAVGRVLFPPLHLHEPLNAVADVVANGSYLLERLSLRVGERPILPPDARYDRTRLAAPHGDQKRRS